MATKIGKLKNVEELSKVELEENESVVIDGIEDVMPKAGFEPATYGLWVRRPTQLGHFGKFNLSDTDNWWIYECYGMKKYRNNQECKRKQAEVK